MRGTGTIWSKLSIRFLFSLIILCFSLLLFSDENAEQEESRYSRDEFHQQYAVELNNLVWDGLAINIVCGNLSVSKKK